MRLESMTRLSILLLALAPLVAPFRAAAQGQHEQGFAYQDWIVPWSWNTEISQAVNVQIAPHATFYALTIGFTPQANETDGAYIGLQQIDGASHARFSVWNSVRATPGWGASCRPFQGEGVGRTCQLPFALATDVTYKLLIRLVSANDPGGPWWEGSVLLPDGTKLVIATIQAPAGDGFIGRASSFVEYFGPDRDGTIECIELPPTSRAVFVVPLLNTGWAGYSGTRTGSCSGGRVTPIPAFGTSVIELGLR
jgi:hypothetical protein